MFAFFGKAARGQMGPYIKFLVLLVGTSIVILGALAASGCDDCDKKVKQSPFVRRATASPDYVYAARIEDPNYKAVRKPGERVSRNLSVRDIRHQPEAFVNYSYTPPAGATNFTFNLAPDNPNGPLPYKWTDVDESSGLEVSFDMPQLPQGQSSTTGAEVLTAEVAETGQSTTVAMEYRIQQPSNSVQQLAEDDQNTLTDQASPGMWEVERFIYTDGVTLTATMCQDWLDLMQSDNAFAAVRLPMEAPQPGLSYTVPVHFGGTYSNSLQLMKQNTPIITAPLEIRPDRFSFVEDKLPQAAGEHWAALGLQSTPKLSCPVSELPIPTNLWVEWWELHLVVLLDLDAQPRTQPVYLCYQGQALPPGADGLLSGLALANLPAQQIGALVQADGVTCIGPEEVALRTSDLLDLRGGGSTSITPTQTITLNYKVSAWDSMTVTIDYDSSLGTWSLYQDAGGGVPGAPIIPGVTEFALNAFDKLDFLAVITVPDVDHPEHHLSMTAASTTSADNFGTISSLFWVGDWRPPPGAESGLYLPMLIRPVK